MASAQALAQENTMFCMHTAQTLPGRKNCPTKEMLKISSCYINCSATRKSKIICARNLKFCSVCGVKICSVNLDRENNFLTLALIRPAGARFVLRGPGTSCGALIHSAAP